MSQSSATMERESADERFELAAVADALTDKGFLLTNTESLIGWARTGSLHLMSFGSPAAPSK